MSKKKKTELTLAIIKPNAIGKYGEIIHHIREEFSIFISETRFLSAEKTEAFYAEHKEKVFFDELVDFMSSGPLIVLVLKSEDAIAKWRKMIGDTDPDKADKKSLRGKYGVSKTKNAVHGSDSIESAKREIMFFFPSLKEGIKEYFPE